jgi:hypothetical protein
VLKAINILSLSSAISISFSLLLFIEREPHLPLPGSGKTIVLQKEENEEEELTRRAEWIENMHKAAPGVDWRAIEKANREERYRAFVARGGQKDNSVVVQIAGGLLSGTWQEKGSNNLAGRSVCADYDTVGHKIYLGADGGQVWKSSFDGSDWEVLNDRFQINQIQLVRKLRKNKANRLFVATDSKSTFYTDDEGAQWQESLGFENLNDWDERIIRTWVRDDSLSMIYSLVIERIAPSNSRVLSLYRSENMGNSFSRLLSIPGTTSIQSDRCDMWVAQYGVSDVYISAGLQNYRYVPEGDTLFQTGDFPDNISGYTILAGHLHQNGNTWLYAYVDGYIIRSDNGGETWEVREFLDRSPFFKTSFTASVQTPDKLFFGDIECYRSNTGGSGWTKINDWFDYYENIYSKLHADIPMVNGLLNEQGQEFFIINTDGGPYYSPEGVQVDNIGLAGLNISQYYSVLTSTFDTNYVFLGSQDQGFQRAYPDNGGILDFEQVISGDYGHIVSGDGGTSIWMVYPGFAIFYPDAAGYTDLTWDFDGNNTYWIPPLMADPFLENVVYMANGNRITRLSQTGNSITAANLPYVFAGPVSAMAVSPLNPERWYAYTENGRFYTSDNSGVNWTSSSVAGGPGSNYLYGSCIYPSRVHEDEVWISGSGYSNAPVYKSLNGGQTFSAEAIGLPSTMVFKLAGTPADEFIFAATESGPFVYVTETQQWHELSGDVAPDQRYWALEYIDEMKTARFATYGRGAWDFRLSTPLSVPVAKNETFNIYPNPCVNQVTIQKTGESNTRLALFDMSGKQVYSGSFAGKTQTIQLNALASGMYLLHIDDGKRRETKRLIINR